MEAIINNLVKAIGWSILHSLWQGAIIFAVLFIALSVKSRMSSRLKHNLSMGALFSIFISFCLTFASLFNLPSKANAATAGLEVDSATLQQLYHFTNSWSLKTESYFPFIVALYAMGISFQLVILTSSYIKLKQLKQTNISGIPAAWLVVAENTLKELGITKKVQFLLSEKVNVPLVVGFIKPVVLFPVALVSQLDIKQVEAILIHELSHIRRNDYVLNLIKTGIETLLFFNPFVWLTSRFIHIEREHACDDLVVKFTKEPVTYAHALLKLELIKDKAQPTLSLAATGKNQHLYQRIKRITNMKTNYMNAKQKILALCLTLATVISLAWINPTKKETKIEKQQKSVTTVATILNSKASNNKLICIKADTDSVKKKVKREIIIKSKDGKKTVYNTIDEMPDSLKTKLADIEKKINSPEWHEKLNKITLDGLEMSKFFDSKEWKDKVMKMEFHAKGMENMFNSAEWKDKIAKIELNVKDMEKKFNSPEWKDKMAKIEFDSKKLEKMFNSKEWKEKMKDIEKRGKEMSEKFNSPEWKKKMKDIEELQNSPEYQQLREKYEKDLEELKKKKGITTEKAFLIYNNAMPLHLANLTLDSLEPIAKVVVTSLKTNLKACNEPTVIKLINTTLTN